jgi:hypothetical protein
MRKMKSKSATKTATVRRTKKKTAKKATAKRKAFDAQMGRATGRDASHVNLKFAT